MKYYIRILASATLSATGILLIAATGNLKDERSIAAKLLGIALASVSAGAGDMTFLGLTHNYEHLSLAEWSNGTGVAGLVGASAYVAATTVLGYSPSQCLLLFSFFPVITLENYLLVLPTSGLGVIKPVSADLRAQAHSATDDIRHEYVTDDEGDSLLSPHRGRVADSINQSRSRAACLRCCRIIVIPS
ncbi:CLN3 protein-domain-containing protein [Nemania serpens]|nr:CLN3 protein-domain-containing protein [Nemania serpens]